MNIYDLSRDYWDYAFENPDKIKPNHHAMYFFAIEHCNRLGWKEKFGFPTSMAMEAVGIKSYNTFINTLKDLVDFGFIEMVEKSKNQYSSNIIALLNFNKALDKALDKALIKHNSKQSESTIQSTVQSIDSIDIPIYNITNLPINNIDTPPSEKKIEEESSLFPQDEIQEPKIPTEQPKRKKVAPKKEKGDEEQMQLEIPEDFVELWQEWKEYRKDKKKKPYAAVKWEQIALNKFLQMSNNNKELGRKILDKTISQNWEGLFKLKAEDQNEQFTSNSNNGSINGNNAGKINGRSTPFTVADFTEPS